MSLKRYLMTAIVGSFALSVSLLAKESPLVLGTPQAIQIETRSVVSDGMESSYYQLSANDFAVNWYLSNPNWRRLPPGQHESSLSFQDSRLPDLQMHLSLYPPNPEITDWEVATIERYIEAVRQQAKPHLIAVLNPGAFRPEVGSLPFVDGNYCVIHMEWVPEDPEQPTLRVSEFIRRMDTGMILAVRFMGPPEVMDRMDGSMHEALSEFVL